LECDVVCENAFVHCSHSSAVVSFADEAENYIDLPPGLLSTSSNTFVNVKPLESVSIATDLLVEPVTTADWELVELDAAWLENGGLLQQVSVVYVNQIIPLVLSNKKDVARIRVLPPTCQQASLWPDESPCLRLVADTRVIVAPKPRKHEFDPKLRLYPTREDCGDAEIQLASHLGVGLVSIDQCTVAIHPNTLSNYDAGRLIGVVRADQEFAIVRIVPCPDVPEEHIGTCLFNCREACSTKLWTFEDEQYHANSEHLMNIPPIGSEKVALLRIH